MCKNVCFWLLLCASSLGLFPCNLYATTSSDHNGYWWNQESANEKLAYVVGFADALDEATTLIDLMQEDAVPNTANKQWRASHLTKTSVKEDINFYEVRFGQLSSGLDEFYKDYRNMNVPLYYALQYVRDTIHGEKQEALDETLRIYRSASASAEK